MDKSVDLSILFCYTFYIKGYDADMKRRMKRYICIILTFIIVFSMTGNVFADQISDLKKKNEEDQKKLDELDEQLDDLESEQAGLEGEIDELEAQIVDMMTSISLLEDEITVKKEEIVQAQSDLEVAIQDEEEQYEAMKLRIQFMYEHGDSSYLDILMNATSMQDVLNKADYDRNLLTQYQETRAMVEELKESLEIEESELEAIMAGYEEEKLGMEETMAELEAVSAEYESQINKAKQQALVYKQQIKQQNAKIAKLEEEARKKAAEEAARKAAANKTTTKVTGSAAVDKQSILAANGSAIGKEVAIYACGFVGNPYVLGGTSLTNGADCSGFVQSVYKAFGYNIPRTSYQQRSAGKAVSYAEAQPGDLICYAGHVAMYIGNGRIVHASSAKTGIKYGYATYRQILAVRRIV